MSDEIRRIKNILRDRGLHENGCASRTSADGRTGGFPPCDCVLSALPWDLVAERPVHVEKFQTADPGMAERSVRHTYADGRQRSWISLRGQPWTEVVRVPCDDQSPSPEHPGRRLPGGRGE